MSVLYIRGVPLAMKTQLESMARASGFPSLNAYLLHELERLVAHDGLTAYEVMRKEQHALLAQQIERNTEVLLEVLDYLKGGTI
ncbi:MAG: hypothetical protein Q4B80_01750 [Aerococcaceae bacterium]|nr:hypothetical protein [Aerococcaceae bacterium]